MQKTDKNETSALKKYSGDGFILIIKYDWPRAREGACRGRVNIRLKGAGKRYLTKREVNGHGSDTPLDCVLYGKTPREIYAQLPVLAADLHTRCVTQGLLHDDACDSNDLYTLMCDSKDFILSMCYSDVCDTTRTKYSGQFDKLLHDCKGIEAEALNDEAYHNLLIKICHSAAETSRGNAEWQPGDEVPSSAKTRINLLCTSINYLQDEGYDIPATPSKQNGLRAKTDCIMDLVDNNRAFPEPIRQALSVYFVRPEIRSVYHLDLWYDSGVRLSEFLGLLWGNIRRIFGSQGYQYYLVVDGQMQDGKRIERVKRDASYRRIPLSAGVGAGLYAQKDALCKRYTNVENALLYAEPSEDGKRLVATPQTIAAHREALLKVLDVAYKDCGVKSALIASRCYTFDVKLQDLRVAHMLSPHTLRRDFCTQRYRGLGYSLPQIYNDMGHAQRNISSKSSQRHTPNADEIYRRCLQVAVSGTPFCPPQALQYTVTRDDGKTEVPTCSLQLDIPPNSAVDLAVYTTEPLTNVNLASDQLLVTQDKTFSLPSGSPAPILIDKKHCTIRYKSNLFGEVKP